MLPVNNINVPANDGPDDSAAPVRPDNEGVGRASVKVWFGTVDGPDERAVDGEADDDEATNRAGNRAGNRASAGQLDRTQVVALGCVLHC